jgi:hypothetical protein
MKHLFIPKEDVTYVDRFTRAGYTGKSGSMLLTINLLTG